MRRYDTGNSEDRDDSNQNDDNNGTATRAFSVFDSVCMEQMMVAFGQWTWVHLMWAHNAIGHVTRVGSS